MGPVDDWGHAISEKYNDVCHDIASQSAWDSINTFLEGVVDHIGLGKKRLKMVEGCWAVKDPFTNGIDEGDKLLAGDAIHTLHQGIAILEARLDIYTQNLT